MLPLRILLRIRLMMMEELVMDGVRNKIAMIGDESQAKLQDTMQKIVNDSNGGMVCIII